MFCKVYTASCVGIDGRIVQVEADMSNGLPSLHIVGEISSEVREAGARIRTAIRNSGYTLPPKRYVVNLAPADFRKSGTGFELPIAVALLCCVEQMNPELLENSIFIGELGLNGNVVPVKGILSMISKACEAGFKNCFIPWENVGEASILPNISVYGIHFLREVIWHLQGRKKLMKIQRNSVETIPLEHSYPLDFKDIRGQELAKRCIQISAAGHHNLLMIGPPGSGKTMMAERIPYILPALDLEEKMIVTKLHSAAGRLKPGSGLIQKRPFRHPHHTVSDKALVGGGTVPIPGEISLAHGGVLFLDEFTEFSRSAVEALRQPMEAGEVFLHRVRGDYCFPARPLVIAAMNPCRCGYYPDRERCRCTANQIQSYMMKISGPIMERMDLCVRVNRVDYHHMAEREDILDSEHMRLAIERACGIQRERFRNTGINYNSEMDGGMTGTFCVLDQESRAFLEKAYEQYHLSARVYQKLLKAARTIADLEGEPCIRLEHITEALCYRLPDETYGGAVWD